jgi:ABC-type amino acid transport substrate-binding protein
VNKQLFQGGSHCTILLQTTHLKQKLDQIAEVQPRFPSVIVSRLGFEVKRVGDLRGHILSIPRGSYTGYPIADDPLIHRELSNGYAQSVRLLKAGRVDAIAGTALSIFFNLYRLGMTRQSYGSVVVFDNTPLWLQCRHKALSADILERLRKATEAVRDAGVVKDILQRYSGGYTYRKGS